MANGNYYYHMITRPEAKVASGARERRCGDIEWRTSPPAHRAPRGGSE